MVTPRSVSHCPDAVVENFAQRHVGQNHLAGGSGGKKTIDENFSRGRERNVFDRLAERALNDDRPKIIDGVFRLVLAAEPIAESRFDSIAVRILRPGEVFYRAARFPGVRLA